MTNIYYYSLKGGLSSKYNYKTIKHKTCAWMAERFLLIAMHDSQLQNRWLPASTYFEAVEKDEYPNATQDEKEADRFILENFQRSINRMHKNTIHNFNGDHNGVLVYENNLKSLDTNEKVSFFYYVTQPGTKVPKPKQGSFFKDNELCVLPKRQRLNPPTANPPSEPPHPEENSETTKEKPVRLTRSTAVPEPPPLKRSDLLLLQSPWDSVEYKKLFKPREGETVKECLARRIADLAHVNRGEKHWIDIIDNHDKDGVCTPEFVFQLRHKCTLLAKSYENALQLMGTGPNFNFCCKKAIDDYSSTSYDGYVNANAVELLNRVFRENENFPCYVKPKPRGSLASRKEDDDVSLDLDL